MLNPALRIVLLTLVAAMCLPVIAQTYPSKPVKVVVGCAANALAVLPHVESAMPKYKKLCKPPKCLSA